MRAPLLACLTLVMLSLSLALPACGPVVTTVRTSSAPPKPGNCALRFIDVDPSAPGSSWETVGQVVIQGGPRDADSNESRARVSPEACRLGGEAVTQLRGRSPSPDSEPVLNYVVLRRSGPPA